MVKDPRHHWQGRWQRLSNADPVIGTAPRSDPERRQTRRVTVGLGASEVRRSRLTLSPRRKGWQRGRGGCRQATGGLPLPFGHGNILSLKPQTLNPMTLKRTDIYSVKPSNPNT